MNEDLDIRKEAVSREYSYFILEEPSPLKSRFAAVIPRPLDVEVMRQAASFLIGEKDFISFTPSPEAKTTVRQVYHAEAKRNRDLVIFSISANSFLPHQIRHTVGALTRVGRGKMKIEEFKQVLEAKVRGLAGPALPPQGLCLMRVNYAHPLGEKR